MKTISIPFQVEYLAGASLVSAKRIILASVAASAAAAVAYSFLVNAIAGNRLEALSLMKEVAVEEAEVARNQTLLLANSETQIAIGGENEIIMEDIGSNLDYLRTSALLVQARMPGSQ